MTSVEPKDIFAKKLRLKFSQLFFLKWQKWQVKVFRLKILWYDFVCVILRR